MDIRWLRDAATAYKVDTDAIAAKVRQEFAAKVKAKAEKKPAPNPDPVVMLVMRLLAAMPVSNDRIALADRTKA